MTFMHMDHNITLSVDAPSLPSSASAHLLKRLAQTQSISALLHITITPAHSSPSSPLTNTFHLLPHTTPVNVKPYRYPHF